MIEIFPPFKYRHSAAERMGLVRKKSVHKKKKHLILPKVDSNLKPVAPGQSSGQHKEIVKLPPLTMVLDAISEEETGFS